LGVTVEGEKRKKAFLNRRGAEKILRPAAWRKNLNRKSREPPE